MNVIKSDVANKIEYFDLFDFINKIKLSPMVLEHMEDTNKNFDEYFRKLATYDDSFVLYFWISLFYDEVKNSNSIEHHNIKDFDLSISNLFMDRLSISHNRIHNIHRFVMDDQKDNPKVGSYRKTPIRVSDVYDNTEEIFWYGAEPEDIKAFMDKFLEVYKSSSPSVLNSNPFLKSSLIHLLFLKIHPYFDGNGRTARTLHNIKFTESLNRIYGMNLKISPINISESIKINKGGYVNGPDNIYFDLDHDNNKWINFWFNLMLSMYDEQLYRNKNIIDNMDELMDKIMKIKGKMKPEVIEQVENMHVKTLKK